MDEKYILALSLRIDAIADAMDRPAICYHTGHAYGYINALFDSGALTNMEYDAEFSKITQAASLRGDELI